MIKGVVHLRSTIRVGEKQLGEKLGWGLVKKGAYWVSSTV